MKKIILAVLCALTVFSLSGCFASGNKLENLDTAQAVDIDSISQADYKNDLDGLVGYLKALQYLPKDTQPVDMLAEVIGAKKGYRYIFTVNGSQTVTELYEFDTAVLDANAQRVIGEIKENGSFHLFNKEGVDTDTTYTAYLSELESNRLDIEAYTYGEQAALCDVYGDEVPELFFISAEQDSHGSRTFSYLHVCTFEDGMLRTLYTCQIHIAAGGGMDYCVFGSSLDKGIAIYLSNPGETQVVRQLTVIRDWDNPEIAAERRTALEAGMDAGSTYTAYGLTTDEAGYENACRDTLSGFEQTILTNCGDRAPDFIRAFIGTADAGDSYASLTAYLQDEIARFSAPAGSAPVPEAAAAAYTEEELRSIVSAYGTIGLWCCEDFDGDGTKEAYALTVAGGAEDLHGIDRVYFVDSQGNLTAMASDITADYYDQEDGYYLTCQGKGFFHVDYGAYGSGYSTMLFSVRNGQPYELALSRQIQGFQLRDGVFYTTENDFSAGFHQYPECELLYDPSAQEFYKGSRIGE